MDLPQRTAQTAARLVLLPYGEVTEDNCAFPRRELSASSGSCSLPGNKKGHQLYRCTFYRQDKPYRARCSASTDRFHLRHRSSGKVGTSPVAMIASGQFQFHHQVLPGVHGGINVLNRLFNCRPESFWHPPGVPQDSNRKEYTLLLTSGRLVCQSPALLHHQRQRIARLPPSSRSQQQCDPSVPDGNLGDLPSANPAFTSAVAMYSITVHKYRRAFKSPRW